MLHDLEAVRNAKPPRDPERLYNLSAGLPGPVAFHAGMVVMNLRWWLHWSRNRGDCFLFYVAPELLSFALDELNAQDVFFEYSHSRSSEAVRIFVGHQKTASGESSAES